MKNIKLYVLSLAVFLAFSCDNELDIPPVSELSTSNFYRTEADFEQAMIGVYSGMQTLYGDVFIFGDIRSDNTVPVISGSVTVFQDFDAFTLDPDNGVLRNAWQRAYNYINRANLILDRIDDAEIEAGIADRIRGEALFARGLLYFNMVRWFGSVPLVLSEITAVEALEFPQSPPDMVYSQIVTDLTAAAGLLPVSYSGPDLGRATSIAANGLLGSVYLTTGNFSAAESALRAVTAQEGSNVGLLPNYADVFDQTNEMNAEIIFAVRYADDGLNGNGFNWGFANLLEPTNKATGTDLYDSYETGDIRRDLTWDNVAAPGEIILIKYSSDPGEGGRGESDWPIVRYADILLMLAEALNEQGYVADGEAFDLLNRTRVRAGLPALTSADVADQAAFRLAMEQERRSELAGEAHRWFDLVRTGRFEALLASKGAKPTSRIFPIPLDEIQKINDPSVLTQNPGY